MTVVIDALDECEGDEDNDRSAVVPLKFFVTSRFEPPIRLGFRGAQGKFIEFPVHEIPQAVIERDITTFLRFRLDEIRSSFELGSDWPDPNQFRRLVKSSVPLFIFVSTTCRFIEDNRLVGGPDDRIKRILEHKAGGTFDATYLPVLSQMVDGLKGSVRSDIITEFKKIVGSIVTLANPLGAAPLACLLGIPTEHVKNRLKLLHSVLDIPSDPGNPLRVFHESFRDFLIHADPDETHEFCVDEKATHQMVAGRCLALLSHEAPGRLRTILDRQRIDRCLPSHIQYACLYWVHHLKKSGVKLDDEHLALPFFLDHFLHWLEALSLIGMISEGIVLINELQGLVDQALLHCNFIILDWFLHQYKTLEGLSDLVQSVVFSQDGQTVASSSYDKTIKLWDAQTGKELQSLEGCSDSVSSIVGRISSQSNPHISVANDWVAFGNENLIWLPVEHRYFICSDVRHDRLALGYSRGNVLIMGFRNN
ncbi:vegetative incompatibility protein HET-E-1 [Penicillium nucicola]|uniref:vegetative incompatibility protein HET-E-1 n=1 Tax=Penicillium nucicola TaxID=1850975 RepID=UPI0025459FA8|nr:vegetative incompatibility protein HET-E-1 [Penicillium nucicola]KAJ5761777.1 vegetative incompatibility protein HET-E-1 [Penicillium nucicola]